MKSEIRKSKNQEIYKTGNLKSGNLKIRKSKIRKSKIRKSINLKSYIFDMYLLKYTARRSIIFKVFQFSFMQSTWLKQSALEVSRNLYAPNIRNKSLFLIHEVNNA